MIARRVFAGILLGISFQIGAMGQEAYVPYFSGDVFADGRPVDRTIEVRLEAQDMSTIATAYTFSSCRFTFSDISLQLNLAYFLTIRVHGYKELRYKLYMEDFQEERSRPGIYRFNGLIRLDLESLPPEKKAENERIPGPRAVDARQLMARISDKARREYELALEDLAAADNKAALTHLEKAVELAPEFYDALTKLGAEYLKNEQYRKAEAILDRACALNPNDPLPLKYLGILYMQESERRAPVADGQADTELSSGGESYVKAVKVLEKAQRLSPLDPRINYYLGTALYKIGDFKKAESLLNIALTLDSKMPEIRLALLNIYMRQKRYDDALKQISAYLEAYPDSPQRGKLEALRGQIKSALSQ